MSKRKETPLTIPRVRLDAPRALDAVLDPTLAPARTYPRAAELAGSAAWTEWLQGALRAVLLPAGVAGAMSLAACGLRTGGDVEPDPTTPLVPTATNVALTPLVPMPPSVVGASVPSLPTSHPVPLGGAPPAVQPTAVVPSPDPIRTPGEAPPVMANPSPTPPPPAPIPPPTSPPHIRGRVASTGTE